MLSYTLGLIALVAFLVLAVAAGSGCAAQSTSTSNVSFNPSDLTYYKDGRTDQCFAVVGASKQMSQNTDSLSVTWVPCDDKVKAILK